MHRAAGPGGSSRSSAPLVPMPPPTSTPPAPISTPVEAAGSRKRRLIGALITPTMLLVAVVGGHRTWTWQAERKLDRCLDELRRKGEPVSLAEIFPAARP